MNIKDVDIGFRKNISNHNNLGSMLTNNQNSIISLKISDIDDLYSFEHPFQKSLEQENGISELSENIKEIGVLEPIIVREGKNGRYELLCGHRRKKASIMAGKEEIPAIIKIVDDDEAKEMVVDNVFQREEILPSELAKAFRIQLEAIKNQGKDMGGIKSRDVIAEKNNTSGRNVSKYIRLNELIGEFLEFVDNKKISINTAVCLSYIPKEYQKIIFEYLDDNDKVITLAEAEELKSLSKISFSDVDLVFNKAKEEKNSSVGGYKQAIKCVNEYIKGLPKEEQNKINDIDPISLEEGILSLIRKLI